MPFNAGESSLKGIEAALGLVIIATSKNKRYSSPFGSAIVEVRWLLIAGFSSQGFFSVAFGLAWTPSASFSRLNYRTRLLLERQTSEATLSFSRALVKLRMIQMPDDRHGHAVQREQVDVEEEYGQHLIRNWTTLKLGLSIHGKNERNEGFDDG